MKRDLDTPILTLDGKEFNEPMTLESVCFIAATASLPEDQSMEVARKIVLFRLAKKIKQGGIVDFTAEEIATLKDRISKCFAIVLMGQAFEVLEADLPDTPAQKDQPAA